MSRIDELFRLDGKVAIITGASRGLGRSAANALAEAGASLVLVGRDFDALKETANSTGSRSATIEKADVNEADQMQVVIENAIRRFGSIDILINNAGIIRRAPAIEYTTVDWDDVIQTNLNSVFAWSKAVGYYMLKQGSGKIVNVASLLSFSGGMNVAAYAAAKGGVAQLTKALANEWAKSNIQVNAIAPGYFRTDATEALRANAERANQILARIPAARWGEPDDLAGAFIFLASKASDYMSGHVMVVDGGFLSF